MKGLAERLRIRSAEHRQSAEAEHRDILRMALLGGEPSAARADAASRLAEFRHRTAERGRQKQLLPQPT